MPNTLAYRVAIPDWEELLGASAEHADTLPDLTVERDTLKDFLVDAKTLKIRQQSLTAARQATTQELDQIIRDGVEVARRIRDAARFKLGQRNEQIVQFNVVPLRRRPRANVEPPAPEPAPEIAAVETTEPEP